MDNIKTLYNKLETGATALGTGVVTLGKGISDAVETVTQGTNLLVQTVKNNCDDELEEQHYERIIRKIELRAKAVKKIQELLNCDAKTAEEKLDYYEQHPELGLTE